MSHTETPARQRELAAEPTIDEIIDQQAVRSVFQPVIHLATGSIAGFEALSRGPAGTALESPMALIEAAHLAGRAGELDWACRARALETAAQAALPDSLSWFVNVEAAGLAMACPPHLIDAQERARNELRVILEVVEREVDTNVLHLVRAADDARRSAWGIALDDVGAEEVSLAVLPLLRPDVVKLDMSLVQDVPTEATYSITGAVRSYAERRGAVILAEGIETLAHEQLAKLFGATYGQGYYYGRPGPLPTSIDPPPFPIPLRQHLPALDGRTPFEVLSATLAPQRVEKHHLHAISKHLENRAAHAGDASVLLAGFQHATYFTASQRAHYARLAASNALTIVLANDLERHDEPTYHVGPPPPGSAIGEEWVVIVLSPHIAAALVARDCGDTGPEDQRRFDFIYAHDRDVVIEAARSFIQDLADPPLHTLEPQRTPGRMRRSDPPTQPRLMLPAPQPSDAASSSPVSPIGASPAGPAGLESLIGLVTAESQGFRATAQVVLDYLNVHLPMGFWSITRVENDRQTYLYLDDNVYGLTAGGSHPWEDSYCVHMVAGTTPRIAPDAAAVPLYAAAAVNQNTQIGAYAGAPIVEPDGTLFGAICGLDKLPRDDLPRVGPILDLLSELLTIALATDRALRAAQVESSAVLTYANTDSLTGIYNRQAWDTTIAQLDLDFTTFADPTVILVIDLDNLKQVNDGPGGHAAGDTLLREAARVLRRCLRERDVVARLGGDEFGVVLTNTAAELGPTVARRLSLALDRADIPASVGWSPLLPDGTAHHAVQRADQAMYEAKRARKASSSPNH